MRKTFDLTHPKIKVDRRVEAARHQIHKYLRRERRKALPEGADYWDFDCKFGDTEDDTRVVHVGDIGKCIDDVVARELTSFYVEILAKAAHRTKREREE